MAGRDARQLYVQIIGDDRQLSRTFKNATAESNKFGRNMTQTFRGTLAGTGAFRALGRQVAFASGTFLGAAGITAVMSKSIDIASNLAEQTNKVGQVFGAAAVPIEEWGKTTATSLGIANDQALEAVGTFGNLFRTVGLVGQKNAELSMSLVKLAADLASFNNASPEETLDALRSGLIGEAEPLRRFGVLLTEARVTQEAMRETGKRNAKELTQQEKILARYNLILKDTAPAQGDFAKTSDGLANAQRSLSAELRDTLGVLGQALLPAVQDITKAMRDWLADPQNQKRLQEDTKKTVGFFGQLLHVGKQVGGGFVDMAEAVNAVHLASMKLNRSLEASVKKLYQASAATRELTNEDIRLQGVAGQTRVVTGEDVGLRGAGARTGGVIPPGGGAGGGGRLSFQGQMNLLETRLAQALTTVSKADDRAILILEKHLLQRWIAHTKDWKLRRQLYEDLARVDGQITAIDEDKAQQAQDAADKEKEAKQKERDAEKKRLEAHRAHIRAMREAWQKTLSALRDAANEIRGEIGDLPFQPTPAGILGVKGQTAKSFASAYAVQTKTFVSFYNSLTRLGKLGVPAALVEQLRAAGPEMAGGVVQGLLVDPKARQALVKSFQQREKVVQQIAHADINARHVTIHMAGSRSGATNASTRRGRQAGVPTSIGSYIGG